jgi:hypothetical protein
MNSLVNYDSNLNAQMINIHGKHCLEKLQGAGISIGSCDTILIDLGMHSLHTTCAKTLD